jgi:PPOX class probable F420-dependent enzyme
MTALDDLGAGTYLSVTSFRADGTPVATPVWLVRRDDELLVLTQSASAKVKRIVANPSVLVAPCDSRGTLLGEQVAAIARLQDPVQTLVTADLLEHRYGLMGRMAAWVSELPGGGGEHVGIVITLV